MADSAQWDEQHLLSLIRDGVPESTELDYKASPSLENTEGKKKEISKDVSAMANSAGGTLIYGIREENHLPLEIDAGLNPNVVTKEWLENVINSRIQRRIDGLIINPVALNTASPGNVAYVIAIPQSSRAPHQASDKRFYKRFNFQSVPMEEYEVRDVSRRADGPLLSVEFSIEAVTDLPEPSDGEDEGLVKVDVMPLIENESAVPAEYITINVYLDKRIEEISRTSDLKKTGDSELEIGGRLIECENYYAIHAIPGKIPIFAGTTFNTLRQPMSFNVRRNGEYFLGYSLLAPYMSKIMGGAVLEMKNGTAKLRGV
ncbi:MAG: AlbA family DNA-binding domain-containing protein [Oceanococcus sp.]